MHCCIPRQTGLRAAVAGRWLGAGQQRYGLYTEALLRCAARRARGRSQALQSSAPTLVQPLPGQPSDLVCPPPDLPEGRQPGAAAGPEGLRAGPECPSRQQRACSDPCLRIRSVALTGLPALLRALAAAPCAPGPAAGPGPGLVARALLAVFQRGRQVWSGAVLGVRPKHPPTSACDVWVCHTLLT